MSQANVAVSPWFQRIRKAEKNVARLVAEFRATS